MILPDGSDTKVANRRSVDERQAAPFGDSILPGTAAYEARLIAANAEALSGSGPLVSLDDAEYALNERNRSGEALPPYTPRDWPATSTASDSAAASYGRRLVDGYALGSDDDDAEEDDELLHSLQADDEASLFSIRRRRRDGKAGPWKERRAAFRKRLFIATFFVFFWSCVMLVVLRSRRGPPGGGRRHGSRPPPPPPMDVGDASTVSCVGFDIDDSQSFVPTWVGVDSSRPYRSINTSMTYVPLNGTQSFMLVEGPYAVGDVLVSTYEPDEGEEQSALRIVVEAIYQVEDEEDADESFERFADSAVCLMSRDGKGSPNGPPDPEVDDEREDDDGPPFDDDELRVPPRMWKKRAPGPRPPARRRAGMGIGIYTRSADNSTFTPDNTAASPLRIRVHLAIPSDCKFDMGHVLDMRSTAMSYTFAEPIGGITFGGLTIRNSIGDITLGHARARDFWMEAGGKIDGELELGGSLKVINNVGNVNLDLTLAELDSDCHGPSCDRREARIQTIGGDSSLRISGWNTDARLDLRTESVTGHSTIHSHPLFEGSVKMFSTTPLAKLDWNIKDADLDDPLGQGRKRNITMIKDADGSAGRLHGTVRWENSIVSQASPTRDSASSRISCRTQLGSCLVTL